MNGLMPKNASQLIDTFGRVHNNLRISVTDRCNLRCTYCMPEEVEFKDKSELLTFEEITRFVEVVAPMGIDKIRLTGGEPLLRRDLPELVSMLTQIPGITNIGITTNALLLGKEAQALYHAGLRKLNISLDTLDADRFRQLTRRDGLEQVLQSIQTAKKVGFQDIKINAVSIRGFTELDLVALAHYSREENLELRLIEYMPIGAASWEREKVFFAHEILETLEQTFGSIVPAPDFDPRAPAMEFMYPDGKRFGIIASISRPFCRNCNRLRLTAEGKFRNCLFALQEADLKPFLRQDFQPEQLRQLVLQQVQDKWEGHEINTSRFVKPNRTMHLIGG